MDREELLTIIRKGPTRITMNDGQSYRVPTSDSCIVSDISVSLLRKSDHDGKWRSVHLPLVSIAAVDELQPES